nr:DUF3265 domain-containing protein [Vibrio harveyi]
MKSITNCLRVICNAWRYYVLVLEVCGDFGIALLSP